MGLLSLHLDHVAALGLAFTVADHVEKVIVGSVGFLVPGLGAEEDALGGNVPQEINVDHLAPDLVLLESSLNCMTLSGGGGGVFPLSSIHNEARRVAGSDLTDETPWKEGTVSEPTDNVELLRLVLGLGRPFPILIIGDPGADVTTGGGPAGNNPGGIAPIFPGVGLNMGHGHGGIHGAVVLGNWFPFSDEPVVRGDHDAALGHVEFDHVLVAIGLVAILETAAMNGEHDGGIFVVGIPVDVQYVALVGAVGHVLVHLELGRKVRREDQRKDRDFKDFSSESFVFHSSWIGWASYKKLEA
jgi:hypothetical protein